MLYNLTVILWLDSFVSQANQQTDVTLVKRFNQWRYNWQDSLEKRMPWLGARQSLLTTSTHSDYSDWGSIISEKTSNNPAPWIYGVMANPGVIWYWVNEDDCDQSRTPGVPVNVFKPLMSIRTQLTCKPKTKEDFMCEPILISIPL